jgi:hypothetical protein
MLVQINNECYMLDQVFIVNFSPWAKYISHYRIKQPLGQYHIINSRKQPLGQVIIHYLLVFIKYSKFIAKPLFAESQLEVKLFAYILIYFYNKQLSLFHYLKQALAVKHLC